MKNNQLIFSKYKNQLLKKGYVVIRNFFNEKESEELKKQFTMFIINLMKNIHKQSQVLLKLQGCISTENIGISFVIKRF